MRGGGGVADFSARAIRVTAATIRMLTRRASSALKTSLGCPIGHPSPTPGTSPFLCQGKFFFWRMSHEWNHTVGNFLRLLFTQHNAFQSRTYCHVSKALSFSSLGSIPLYAYISLYSRYLGDG